MISIVTPTLNSALYLAQTISSIRNQIGNIAVEHIVVDGGSTDDTHLIVEQAGISKYFELAGSSMYEAIDFGFKQSTGKILCWLNSDDMFIEDTAKTVYDFFTENDSAGIVAGNTIYFDQNGKDMYEYRFPKLPPKIFRSFGTLFLCQSSIFWRRELYFECGGLNLNYRLTSDRDLILRITEKSRLEYIDKVLSRFRLHSQNLSKTKAYLADTENKSINEALNVGPTTILKKVYAAGGHLYVKLKNPAMINWKLKNLFNLKVKR